MQQLGLGRHSVVRRAQEGCPVVSYSACGKGLRLGVKFDVGVSFGLGNCNRGEGIKNRRRWIVERYRDQRRRPCQSHVIKLPCDDAVAYRRPAPPSNPPALKPPPP